jgi:type IV pilus assembly protein PilY1
MNPRLVTTLVAMFLLFGLVLIPSVGTPTPFQCCSVPVVAGVATKPNVMLVMDYSGSMQFRAYYDSEWGGYYGNRVAYGYRDTDGSKVYAGDSTTGYNPTQTYYGIFQSNVYYTYDKANKQWITAATQPVTAYSFTDKSRDGGTVPAWSAGTAYVANALVSDGGKSYLCTSAHTSASTSEPGVGANWMNYWMLAGSSNKLIQLTAAGHNFQVGQLVEFQGLTSNTGMNGNAYFVTAVSGNTFTVAYPYNGNPDNIAGSAQRRIPGTLLTTYGGVTQTPGLSGNILNFVSASRIDAALQALIGGKATCDTNNCYVRGQGERSYISEYYGTMADFYVRMADNDSSATYPNNYSSGSYTSMTSYVSISGRYTGSVTATSPSWTVCTSQHCTHYTCTDWSGCSNCTEYLCNNWTCPNNQCTWTCPTGHCTQTDSSGNCTRCDSKSKPTSPSWNNAPPWVCSKCNGSAGPCAPGTVSCPGWSCQNADKVCDKCNGQPGPCASGAASCPGWTCANSQCDTWVCDTSNTYYYEAYTFTTGSAATHIDLTLHGTWTGTGTTSYLALFNSTDFTQTPVVSNTGSVPTISYDLAANTTYYVVVAANATTKTGTYILTSSQELTGYDPRNPANPSVAPGTFSGQRALPTGATVPIGSIPQAQVKIKVNSSDRLGVVQQNFNLARFGFMYYNSDHEGQILVGCDNTDLNTLLNAFNNIYPYNGTPTGEALTAAKDYFAQVSTNSADYSSANNSAFIGQGTSVDPYYQRAISGDMVAVTCRKSYVVLISDGAWNGSIDPIRPARDMHAVDLRTESDTQTVDVFSIFVFNDTECGKRSMKGVAMFGGFLDSATSACGSSNGWPYPYTDYVTSTCEVSGVDCEGDTPTGSRCMKWPQTNCDPNGTYNNCCKEWDANFDKYTTGDNLDKGVPDNYFEASQGGDLQAALLKVLSQAIVKNATASAVATVAQQTQEGDIIIRGLFHASDPETVGRYLWFGHLEAYWPWLNESTMTWHYDFETNPCFEITGTKNCWDGAEVLRSRSTNDRTIYYWDPTASPSTQQLPARPQPTDNPPWDSSTITSWQTRMGLATNPTPQDLDDWVRGNDNVYEAGFAFRDRDGWELGDIIYSTPVVIGTPSVGGVSTHDPNRDEFYAYRNSVYYRDKVIYVGANDGMIHAFLMARWNGTEWITQPDGSNEIGKELWAYTPSNLLSELQYLAKESYGAGGCIHRAMVDLAPQSWEVYIKPPGATTRSWRTVILGGERGGGDVYFAIDVTDPANPQVLWEYSVLKNRILYSNTSTRSLSNCYSTPSAANCTPDTSKAWPFITDSAMYEKLKVLPMSFSRPAVGRLNIPTSLPLYTGDPASSGTTVTSIGTFNFDGNQARHVAFVGGGIRIFQDDASLQKDPSVTATTDPLTASQRFDLFRPDFMAIDIETGKNLLRYYWPIIQNQTSPSTFYSMFPVLMPSEPWLTGTAYNVDDAVANGGQTYVCKLAHTAAAGSQPGVGASWSTYWTLLTKINFIPYAFSDPLALDVRNAAGMSVGDDGFTDIVYVGDIAGNFFGLKFNFDTQVISSSTGNPVANTDFGIKVDWWQTKQTYSGNPPTKNNSNNYRSLRQPITVPPVASFDGDTTNGNFLHVIFGAGKFEDIADSAGVEDDKSDLARTSIYNLKDLVIPPKSNFFSSNAVSLSSGSATFKIEVNPRCPSTHTVYSWPKTGDNRCTWTKTNGSTGKEDPDCCEATCPAPAGATASPAPNPTSDTCWSCVYDLTYPVDSSGNYIKLNSGERVVRKGLIAGGLLFMTTFWPPQGPCDAQGSSNLYVVSYDCGPIPGGKSIFDSSVRAIGLKTGATNTYDPRGWMMGLGTGVASNPVLDSSGTHVIIQMSTGDIINLNVNLPQKVMQPMGWRER